MISPTQTASGEEQRLVLNNVSWQHYQSLLATLEEQAGLKLTYYYGTLELLMPSAEHERIKKAIARLLERYAEEMDIILHGYGSTTFRKEAKASGLEPDECYCIETWKDIPDFAIEVNISSGQVDKLKVYQHLGVPEVLIWQNNQLTLYDLRGETYTATENSQFFPELDWQFLAQYISPQEQPQAVKAFLRNLRSESN